MRLYPAIDILGGAAVRLVRGDFDAKKVYDTEPLAAARAWVQDGAEYLHVVDLDGAKAGKPVNVEHLRRIAAEAGVPVQYGGGLRTPAAVREALAAGAERVIVGTAAFAAPELLRELLEEHAPERVLVGVDVREGYVATHGWQERTTMRAGEALAELRAVGIRGFVFTDIDHDGMLDGPDADAVAGAVKAAGSGSVIVSGGIGTVEHLQALAGLRRERALDQLEGVIVGTALYERRFTVREAQEALAD